MKLLPIAAVAVLVPLSAAVWAQTPPSVDEEPQVADRG